MQPLGAGSRVPPAAPVVSGVHSFGLIFKEEKNKAESLRSLGQAARTSWRFACLHPEGEKDSSNPCNLILEVQGLKVCDVLPDCIPAVGGPPPENQAGAGN